MKNKMIALVLIVVFLFGYQTTFAENEESDYINKVNILTALGILDDGIAKNSDVSLSAQVLNTAIKRMMSDEVDETVDNENTKDAIVFEEAIKNVVDALGYKIVAENQGGYPNGYLCVAANINLLQKVNGQVQQEISIENGINLLYNMLDVQIYRISSIIDSKVRFNKYKDSTILSVYRNIYKINGVVTANGNTTLTERSNLSAGDIQINDTVYHRNTSDAQDYLGMKVTAYVKELSNDDTDSILYMTSYKKVNNVLVVNGEDIESVADNCQKLTIRLNNDKTKNINVSPVVKVIYNGIAYNDYTSLDFKPQNGSIRFVDNDNDEIYDLAFITYYETMIVDRVSTVNEAIYNKYSYVGALGSLLLEECDYTISKNGVGIQLGDVKEWNVIHIAKSKSEGKKLVQIIVSDLSVSGTVKEINWDDETVCIDDKTYDLSNIYRKAVAADDTIAKEIKVGEKYQFYLDENNAVVAVHSDKKSSLSYVYLFEIKLNNNINNDVLVKYFNTNGEWIETTLSDKLTFNAGAAKLSKLAVYNQLAVNAVFEPQVVGVKLDNKGLVTEIYTAVETSDTNDELLTKTSSLKKYYRATNRSFGSEIYLDADATVILIPDDGSKNEEDYSIESSSYLVADMEYEFVAYNLDEYSFTDLVLVKRKSSQIIYSARSGNFFVVDKVISCVNSEGEARQKLYGSMGQYQNITVMGAEATTFSGIKHGDVVQFHMDLNGNADYVIIMYSIDNGREFSSVTELYASYVKLSGNVNKINISDERIKVDCGNVKNLRLPSATPVSICCKNDDNIRKAKVNDIEEGDYVLLRLSWGVIKEVVVIRF